MEWGVICLGKVNAVWDRCGVELLNFLRSPLLRGGKSKIVMALLKNGSHWLVVLVKTFDGASARGFDEFNVTD